MADYHLAPAAQRDLEDVFDYTVERWGPVQAMRYAERIVAACADLADAPERAQRCDHVRPGYRRRAVEQHVIYFQATAYGIAVIRILHQRMDVNKLL